MSEKEKLPWGLKQTAPGTMKAMSKDALTSFDQGTLSKKHLSKKELEELKKKQEDQAAAELLKDFEASFNEKKAMAKMFIKGTVINPSTKGNLEALSIIFTDAKTATLNFCFIFQKRNRPQTKAICMRLRSS
jgi:type IV secretory pathway VirJ component